MRLVWLLIFTACTTPGSESDPPPPTDDGCGAPTTTFWDVPSNLPTTPGALVKCERLPATAPYPTYAGYTTFRMMYTSTYTATSPIGVATSFAFVPTNAATERSVIAYTHGGTGNNTACGPTVLNFVENNSGSGDWIHWLLSHEPNAMLVYPDYSGLGADVGARAPDNDATVVDTQPPHATLQLHTELWTGVSTIDGLGRPTIDAVRASAQLPNANRGANAKFVAIGYSQGGYAALATGEVQPTYAPELELTAVYAGDPAQDSQTVYDDDSPQLVAHVLPLGMANLSTVNPGFSLATVLTPANQSLFAQTDGKGCALAGGFASYIDASTTYGNLGLDTSGAPYQAFMTAATANTPGHAKTTAPIVILQVDGDPVITIKRTNALATREAATNPGNLFYCVFTGQNLGADLATRAANHAAFDFAMFDKNGPGTCVDSTGAPYASITGGDLAANITSQL